MQRKRLWLQLRLPPPKSPVIALLYIALKCLAYTGWCLVGTRTLCLEHSGAWALPLGLIRSLMGLFFGVLIYVSSSYIYTNVFPNSAWRDVLTYVMTYVPVRWVEWSIIGVLIAPKTSPLKQLIIGVGAATRWWRLGGVVVSFAADLPLILALGGILPVGRFMC